jgi:regulator of nonsense transcripts 3
MAPPTHPVNGVLEVPAAVLKKKDTPPTQPPRGPRKPAERLKVIIRRLPPGLTQAEFEAAIGEEWKVGAGKINWFDYKPGKISKDFSKPSRPGRAYLNVTAEGHLAVLKERVLRCNFVDAKNTARDAALIGPPTLEYAPYSRVPLGKRRTDTRQGTIDQDPEFIDFLQSLTNPVTKPTSLDAEPALKKEEITTTPLIEHLREKKAAKEKAGKGGKAKQEAKESKGEKANKKAAKGASETPEKPKKLTKAEKAAREAVKVLNKETAAVAEKTANSAPERKPERAARPISVAARIQQDLGLSPAGRRAKRDAAADSKAAAAGTATSQDAVAAPAGPATQPPKRGPKARRSSKSGEKPTVEASAEASKPIPTGPAQPTLLKKPAQAPKGQAATQPTPPKGPKAQQPAQPTPGTPAAPAASADPATLPRQGFLKHANPSQGITEPLIEEALKVFGAIEKVEIDRKKGFAYVDFADHEGLKKAIAASPVKVAEGAVQVLEKREKPAARAPPAAPMHMHRGGGFRGGRSGRGGRGGGRGGAGGGGHSPSPANATPAGASGGASANAPP